MQNNEKKDFKISEEQKIPDSNTGSININNNFEINSGKDNMEAININIINSKNEKGNDYPKDKDKDISGNFKYNKYFSINSIEFIIILNKKF